MSRYQTVAIASAILLLFSGASSAETWSCALNEKIGGATVEQYKLDGTHIKELTSDKLWREILPDKNDFMGFVFNISVNNKYALIAESDYAGLNSEKIKELYVVNIIIDKSTQQIIKTSILSRPPAPREIETVEGSCTFDK